MNWALTTTAEPYGRYGLFFRRTLTPAGFYKVLMMVEYRDLMWSIETIRSPSGGLKAARTPNPAVQRTRASRYPRTPIKHQRRLARVADFVVRNESCIHHVANFGFPQPRCCGRTLCDDRGAEARRGRIANG